MSKTTDQPPPNSPPPGRAFEHIARAEALDPNGIFAALTEICSTNNARKAADALKLIAPKATQAAAHLHASCGQSATLPPLPPSSGPSSGCV